MFKKICKPIKLIIDTDIGSDIDDLYTLYFALTNPNIDLIGVVASYENSPLRALQVKHVLKLFNREDIPVFVGVGKPMKSRYNYNLDLMINQYTPEIGTVTEKDYSGKDAVDFLINKARELQDELVILEIAPETTLAMAILKDKEAFAKTRIQLMAGEFYRYNSEWNVQCDYEAARIVATSGLDLTYIGLDVCDCTEYKDKEMINLMFKEYDDPKLSYLSTCTNLWQKTLSRGVILYDSIALITIFDPTMCTFETRTINFEAKNNDAFIYLSDTGYKARIAKTIDQSVLDAYLKELFLGGQN